MRQSKFPFLAVGIGLVFSFAVFKGSELRDDGTTLFPLLALLTICELAFFVTAFGAYSGLKQIRTQGININYIIATSACVLLCLQFLWRGIELWPL